MAEGDLGDLFPSEFEFDGSEELDDAAESTLEEFLNSGEEVEDDQRHEWLVAPIPSYNPTLGWTVTVPASILYHPSFVDQENPVWATGVGGFYSENDSWGAGLFHRMNLKDDAWRLSAAAFYADINYKFYGVGGDAGNPDIFLRLGQRFGGGRARILRRISEKVHFGLRFTPFNTEVYSVKLPSGDSPELKPPWYNINVQVSALGPILVFDSRDSEFYPTSGNHGSVTLDFGDAAWGSDFDYELFSADWNYYRKVTGNGVMALRVATKYASGNTPFFLLPAIGQGSDLRGYPAGLYRDRVLVAGQAEYRHRLTNRLGFVVFAGLGSVAEDWDSFDTSLPSYGGGIRWVLAPKNDISLRVDYAQGRDENEIYVGIGEAF